MTEGQRPNVLLITLDQLRADCMGVAGHPVVKTPTLDRLAAEGVRFTNHFTNCVPCASARASLLTGLWQMNHRVTGNGAPLADDLPMLPRELRALGYTPTLFGYTDTTLDPRTLPSGDPRLNEWELPMSGFELGLLLDEKLEPWLEWLRAAGYDVPRSIEPIDIFELPISSEPLEIYRPQNLPIPEGRGATWQPTTYRAEHSESAFLTERALEWLEDAASSSEPWCAHLSYLRPHSPYIAPEPYNNLYDPADVPPIWRQPAREQEFAVHPFLAGALAVFPSPEDDLDQRQLQATYYGMVTEVDHALGVFLDGLKRLGQDENTIVVVAADHGEQLGDHWLVEKFSPFDQGYRIPLIVRWPGMKGAPGRAIEAFTESVDIVPTLIDLCGGTPPQFCDGASLRPFLDGETSGSLGPPGWRDAVHLEFDFRFPTSTMIEDLFGIRQDQCSVATLRDERGKYVHFAGGLPPLFFDLEEDPGELNNLADDPSYAEKILEYSQRLLTLRMEHTDPRLANHRATPSGPVHRADPPRPGLPLKPA